MTVREARAAALTRWHRDLSDNFTAVLPRVLDDLDAIDREHVPDMVAVKNGLDPTDAELTAWIEAHPREFEAMVRRQNRINGAPPSGTPAKPAPRRRTARKADG